MLTVGLFKISEFTLVIPGPFLHIFVTKGYHYSSMVRGFKGPVMINPSNLLNLGRRYENV
jgi:hypothetical protein